MVERKSDAADARLRAFQEELPVHRRIRNRREAQDLTVAELAKRTRVSTAYISLIERGFKVPTEEVAIAIANSLGDDRDLYLLWARAGRHPTTSESRRWYDAISADPRLRRSLAAGDDLPLHRINLLRPARAPRPRGESASPPTAISIPVLPWLVDPGEPGGEMPGSSDVLWLDTRLLPRSGHGDLFAYLVGDVTPREPFFTPGSHIVMTRRVRQIQEDRIYAIRLGERIALGSVAFRKDLLLLLPPAGARDFEAIRVGSAQAALKRLAAVGILALWPWK